MSNCNGKVFGSSCCGQEEFSNPSSSGLVGQNRYTINLKGERLREDGVKLNSNIPTVSVNGSKRSLAKRFDTPKCDSECGC